MFNLKKDPFEISNIIGTKQEKFKYVKDLKKKIQLYVRQGITLNCCQQLQRNFSPKTEEYFLLFLTFRKAVKILEEKFLQQNGYEKLSFDVRNVFITLKLLSSQFYSYIFILQIILCIFYINV